MLARGLTEEEKQSDPRPKGSGRASEGVSNLQRLSSTAEHCVGHPVGTFCRGQMGLQLVPLSAANQSLMKLARSCLASRQKRNESDPDVA